MRQAIRFNKNYTTGVETRELVSADEFAMLSTARVQEIASRVDIWDMGNPRHSDLAISGGTVTLDGTAEHYGRCSFNPSDPTLLGELEAGILSAAGYEAQIWRGVYDHRGLPCMVPLGVFGLTEPTIDHDGTVTIEGWDRSKRVDDAKLTKSYRFAAGGAVVIYLLDLIFQAFPWEIPWNETGPHLSAVAETIYERGTSRWKIQTENALAYGSRVFFDGFGAWNFVPESDLSAADPVATISGGDAGVLRSAAVRWSREESHNAWTVQSENSDSGSEFVGTAFDSDPRSLTYWGPTLDNQVGRFGPKPADIVRLAGIESQFAADSAARARKAASLGLDRQVTASWAPNAAIEPFDGVLLGHEIRDELDFPLFEINEVVLVDSVTYGLGADDDSSATVRRRQDLT